MPPRPVRWFELAQLPSCNPTLPSLILSPPLFSSSAVLLFIPGRNQAFVVTPPRFPATTGRDGCTSTGTGTGRKADVSSAAMSMAAEAGAGAGAGGPVPGKSMLRSRAVGIGSSAPSTVLPNSDLEELVETSDEWIASRTGIRKRHLLKKARGGG